MNHPTKLPLVILSFALHACSPLPINSDTATELDQPDAEHSYTYGALLEPPAGRILHGSGQWQNGNANYMAALEDAGASTLQPASELNFMTLAMEVEEGGRDWQWGLDALDSALQEGGFGGQVPSLSLQLRGAHLHGEDYYEGYGVDDEVANSDVWDERILQFIDVVGAYGEPVFLRIGGEFSGWWNGYQPWEYPKAFRKIVHMFRAAGVDNVAFVWCYEPAAPADFDEMDSEGNYKWFPGDDVIDWYSIDVFHAKDFSGGGTHHERTEAFLQMALEHEKPVVVAESSPRDLYITDDTGAASEHWQDWFASYFEWINAHPQIKAFHYINVDWSVLGHYGEAGWGQADISVNPALVDLYVSEIASPQYLHLSEIDALKGL